MWFKIFNHYIIIKMIKQKQKQKKTQDIRHLLIAPHLA